MAATKRKNLSSGFLADSTILPSEISGKREERYARYNNTSYNLEPDIKHSPGGLRDLHLLSWIMLRHYRMASFESLLKAKILMPEEYQEIKAAEAELFRIRFALHLQLKRPDNRLRFDRQLSLSEQLGYKGEGNQPAETMMRDFFKLHNLFLN